MTRSVNATYFDSLSSNPQLCRVQFDTNIISLIFDNAQRNFSPTQSQLLEPFANAPLLLEFEDGTHCEIKNRDDQQFILQVLSYRPSRVEIWQQHWRYALLAIVLTLSFLFVAYRYGGPMLARQVVPLIPQAADEFLGQQAEVLLQDAYLTPTKTSDAQYNQAIQVFRRIQPTNPRLKPRLEMRASKRLGANAFALPNGSIYVTDAMFDLLSRSGKQLSQEGEYELAGLLAHEIAHIELRHSMLNLTETSFMTVVVGSLVGDFSSLVSAGAGALLGAQYSQEKERQADTYAIQVLKSKGISPKHLAHLFRNLEKHTMGKNKPIAPTWITHEIETYLSTHPTTQERIRYLETAAGDSDRAGYIPRPTHPIDQ
ncbi:M48 family metallopeptidase [Undibacterium fentianense]|nr:M48 family metallopeptidase [Undibacterium fentianense]